MGELLNFRLTIDLYMKSSSAETCLLHLVFATAPRIAQCEKLFILSPTADLRWVQANSAEEAFKVMRLGRKNQSFSSTKLNQLSSRRWAQYVFPQLSNVNSY